MWVPDDRRRQRPVRPHAPGDDHADGRVELLVPTTARTDLAAVARTADGAAVEWRLPLDGGLRTNLTGVTTEGGGVAVGAGTADGVRVWQAQ